MKKKDLLEVRKKIKDRKPDFIRQDAHKKKRLSKKWRKPKGVDSKMRHNRKGYRRNVSVGWGSPKEVKGLHKSGLEMVNLNTPSELDDVDPKTQGIIISRTLGMRKKIQVIEQALKKDIRILNFKDPKNLVEETKKKMAEKEDKEDKEEKTVEKAVEKEIDIEEEKKKTLTKRI